MAQPVYATQADEGWIVTLDQDGEFNVIPATESALDAFQTCTGVSPMSSSCVLQDNARYGWSVGWFLPPTIAPTPHAAAVMNTKVVMTGTNTATPLIFECNWVYTSAATLPSPAPPPVRCRLNQFSYVLGGLTATFTNNLLNANVQDPSLPQTNNVPAAVGSWQALLFAI